MFIGRFCIYKSVVNLLRSKVTETSRKGIDVLNIFTFWDHILVLFGSHFSIFWDRILVHFGIAF